MKKFFNLNKGIKMEKVFIYLSLVLGVISASNIFAATLTLQDASYNYSTSQATTTGPVTSGTVVSDVETLGPDYWVFTTDLNHQIYFDFDQLAGTSVFSPSVVIRGLNGSLVSTGIITAFSGLLYSYLLGAGTYLIEVGGIATGDTYRMTLSTPIPAAIWLFGSALLGLIGISSRKSRSTMAL